ncbi:MAG: hypothetical protein JOZ62_20210, partial [Acidobacteriaceae bacterium]|nr:hypothetical protein [Acidobacteriaceae bacterium]
WDDPRYRHFHDILQEVWRRYGRPIFVAETGTEDHQRATWFNYVCDEVAIALTQGIPVHGICLYPIINHPGWDDDRHCCNGLFDYPDAFGNRAVYQPLAEALLLQQKRLAASEETNYAIKKHRPDLLVPSSMGVRVSTTSTFNEPVHPQPESFFS